MSLEPVMDSPHVSQKALRFWPYFQVSGTIHWPVVLITVFLALTAFAVPISVSLKAIFLIAAVVSIVLFQWQDISKLLRCPWFYSTMLLFVVIVLGCLIGPSENHRRLEFVLKYSKLLFLPILALGFQKKLTRTWAINAYLFAMLLTFFGSLLKSNGVFAGAGTGVFFVGDPGAVFYNHILTGCFMAFAAFLAAINAMKSLGLSRVYYSILGILFSYQVFFINTGRTGYLLYFILMFIFLCSFMRAKVIWIVFLLSLLVAGSQSLLLKNGMNKIFNEVQHYTDGKPNTSVGFRLQFHQYAQDLFLRSPWLGLGTATFSYYFHKEQPVPAWGDFLLEPHGEYWMIAAEHGVVGLCAFLFFMMALFWEVFRVNTMRIMYAGILVTFFAACSSDGFLLLSVPGYFFIFFAAMALGETLEKGTSA